MIRARPVSVRAISAVLAFLVPSALHAESSAAQPLGTGERLYLEGRLASGEPVGALLPGGVTADGSLLTCVSCHRRSGMGAIEGDRVVTAVAGPILFAPRDAGYAPRPAYTEETLARALRGGIDAAGRPLDPLMPRYVLDDASARALIAYLRSLGGAPSPGVDDESIRFATIVAPGADPEAERAMLNVLETFFAEKSRQTRRESRRAAVGPNYQENRTRAYRDWSLSVWRLGGEPATWPAQLDAAYAREPVFAVLSGISGGEWRPVHEFCERQRLPCLVPNADLPPFEPDDYYSVYFSPGVALEAEAIAHDVAAATDGALLQVFADDAVGRGAARALREALLERDGPPTTDWVLDPETPPSAEALAAKARDAGARILVGWLPREMLAALAPGAGQMQRIYVSSTMLGDDLGAVPPGLRERTVVAHLHTLPGQLAARRRYVSAWHRSRGIESPAQRVQSQTYFACRLAARGLNHIKQHFDRDYFLDSLDHAESLAPFATDHPRLSFGPGQRYLSKGCYLVPLSGGEPRWIVP